MSTTRKFDNVADDGLIFSNIVAVETSIGTTNSFISDPVVPTGATNTPVATIAGLNWANFVCGATGPGSSLSLVIDYDISADPSAARLISAIRMNSFVPDTVVAPGTSMTLKQEVFDSAGNLVGRSLLSRTPTTNDVFDPAFEAGDIQLSGAYSALHVRLTIEVSIASDAAPGTDASFSVMNQSFNTVAVDYGDAPDSYGTLDASNGARHVVSDGVAKGTSALFLGSKVDSELDGQPNATATGDDIAGASDDEDGITLPTSITAGQSFSVSSFVTKDPNVKDARLSAWIDFNVDGDFNDAGEQILTDVLVSAGNNVFTITAPTAAGVGDTYARFRLSTDSGLSATGLASNGEVEDYRVTLVAAEQRDYGDLPSPLYSGVLGAYHVFANQDLRLGSSIDAEASAQPNGTATGDDLGGVDDENGLTLPTSIFTGGTATFNVSATNFSGSAATLYGFVDWNADGDFADANESVTASVANGFSGNVALNFAVPTTAVTGTDLGVRLRISNDANLDAVKVANSGEVEDYVVRVAPQRASLGDYVWEDLNANGIQDDGAGSGVAGVTVTLIGGGADGIINGVGDTTATTTTNASGFYQFTNLNPGEQYQVQFSRPTGYASFTRPDAGAPGTDATDSDANVTTGRTSTVVLNAGENNLSLDAGLLKAASLGDYVWRDTNGNGIQDDGNTGVNGVSVTLTGTDALGNAVTRTTTTGDDPTTPGTQTGYYMFNDLLPGTYKVTFSNLPSGLAFTAADQGTSDALDSDANPTTGATGTVTLGSGTVNRTLDAGLVTLTPGIEIIKDVSGPIFVAPHQPVTFTYSVRNTGNVEISNVSVIDDNATPGYAFDDFAPTATLVEGTNGQKFNVGDLDRDGRLDTSEVWQYTATVVPPVDMIVKINGVSYNSGSLTYTTLANGDVRVVYLQDKNFNDNTYGTGSDSGWTSQGKTHKFSDLVGSDKAGFLVTYSDGTTLAKFYQDYISKGGSNTEGYSAFSGYQSLGISGGEGKLLAGSSSLLKDFDSTLEWNLNQAGTANNGTAYSQMFTNSPINDAKWNVVNGYAFTIDKAAFASGKTLGSVTIFDQHNSPKKTGDSNSYVPEIVGGPSTNTATVSALLNGNIVVAVDDATVNIVPPVIATKFFVADDCVDDVFRYASSGKANGDFGLRSGNTDPRDIAANLDGSTLWVLDKDKNVNVYGGDGSAKGLWKAEGLDHDPEGITLDGNDLWLADRDGEIYWFDNAATRLSGSDSADKTFCIDVCGDVKGIVTDGSDLWAVVEGSSDLVYRFTIKRDNAGNPNGLSLDGSWQLATGNSKPTGITLDPSGASQSLWVVDESSDTVYEYGNGRALTSGKGTVTSSFKLASDNVAPQGIADPLPFAADDPTTLVGHQGAANGFLI